MNPQQLKNIVEAALLAAGEPLSIERLLSVFGDNLPERAEVRAVLDGLAQDYAGRSVELIEVGSGFRFQVRQDYAQWVNRLWEERPARYSRALLETLALIAYRQPITRAEIEDIRGVSVSTHIIKTLHEREWIRVLGHRDVPGKPAIYGTTRHFLDHFNLKSLDELPTLAEIRDLDSINVELDFGEPPPETGETNAEQQEPG
ncbi:MAG: SMC-Scp complex subunit ScpB [Gammaproteobacteria bacterium]